MDRDSILEGMASAWDDYRDAGHRIEAHCNSLREAALGRRGVWADRARTSALQAFEDQLDALQAHCVLQSQLMASDDEGGSDNITA